MADDYPVIEEQTQESGTFAQREARRKLGKHLADLYCQYKKDRKAAEEVWLNNLRQYLGKYDPALLQNMDANTSRAYPKITRVKCVSTRARLMSLLFPAGEKNWGISASPVPDLPEDTLYRAVNQWYADNPGRHPTQADLDLLVKNTADAVAVLLEQVIDDQLSDIDPFASSDYQTLAGMVIASAILYGPGVAKGPCTIAERKSKVILDQTGAAQIVTEDAFRPFFEFVSCWNYYPDMTAANFESMGGQFERHVYSRHQLMQVAKRSDFDGDAIQHFVESNRDGNYTKTDFENELQAIGGQNANAVPKGDKYEAIEYWGSCPAKWLRDAGALGIEGVSGDEDVRFTAWVLNEEVVKLAVNPLPEGAQMYHHFIFEEDETNLMGSGLPPIMRDSQLAVASATRMMIDNASLVCGPNVEVDLNLISPSQTDMSLKPRKVWLKEGTNNNQRAVQSVSFDSHINELLSVITTFKEFANDETFINAMTGGDMSGVSGEALRTTGGASMAYGAAALPFRDIVRNYDRFTFSVIHALVEWNRIFNDARDQMMGDTRPIPKGATSLMAKEMRAFAINQFAVTLTPEERVYLNHEGLFDARLQVNDLPINELKATPEEIQQRQAAQAEQAQSAAAQAQAMFQATLQNLSSDTVKQLSQAQKNLDNADVAVFKAMTEALNNGLTPEELSAIAQRVTAGRAGRAPGAGSSGNASLPGAPNSATVQ